MDSVPVLAREGLRLDDVDLHFMKHYGDRIGVQYFVYEVL